MAHRVIVDLYHWCHVVPNSTAESGHTGSVLQHVTSRGRVPALGCRSAAAASRVRLFCTVRVRHPSCAEVGEAATGGVTAHHGHAAVAQPEPEGRVTDSTGRT